MATALVTLFDTWLKLSCWQHWWQKFAGWRVFPTARTAKHFRKFVRIVTQAKKKVQQLPAQKYIKILVSTPPSFSARAHFWCFNLQQHSFNLQQLVLKICSNFIQFAATLHYLQQLFNLQHVPCGPYRCLFMDHYNAFITDLYGCELSPWLSFEISKKYERRGLVCSCDTALTGIYCELLIECKYSVHIHFCSTRHFFIFHFFDIFSSIAQNRKWKAWDL